MPKAAAATISEPPKPTEEVAAVFVEVKKLLPWVKNPRKNDAAVDAVIVSIERFGFGAPLLARKANGEIIAGHTRIKAALQMGLATVPVRYLDLSEKEAHLLALADNKTGELAKWDDEMLSEILGEYDETDKLAAGFAEKNDKAVATEVEEIDVSAIQAEFWMSVRGPLPSQPEALERLKTALAELPGVSVEHGIIE